MPPSVPQPPRALIVSLALKLSVSHHFRWGLHCFLLIKKGVLEPCLHEWVCVLSLHNPHMPAAGELETRPGGRWRSLSGFIVAGNRIQPSWLKKKKEKEKFSKGLQVPRRTELQERLPEPPLRATRPGRGPSRQTRKLPGLRAQNPAASTCRMRPGPPQL